MSRAGLAVGCETSLWDPPLLRWLHWIRRTDPAVALRVHVGLAGGIVEQVAEGIIDIGIVYAPPHRAGPLSLDLARRQAYVRGNRVELTRQEFDVLHHLSTRPGVVLSRAALLERAWSHDSQATGNYCFECEAWYCEAHSPIEKIIEPGGAPMFDWYWQSVCPRGHTRKFERW